MNQNKIYLTIIKSIYNKYYNDLGIIEFIDESTINNIQIKVIPHEGFHSNIEYIITCKFINGPNNWPLIFIDSEIYNKIKTPQYLQNIGKKGIHKGICIKNFSYSYSFDKNFTQLCDNKWENYIYYLITVFNNIQDFEKGNGLKSNYKDILFI